MCALVEGWLKPLSVFSNSISLDATATWPLAFLSADNGHLNIDDNQAHGPQQSQPRQCLDHRHNKHPHIGHRFAHQSVHN
jgi:hypothetical protein